MALIVSHVAVLVAIVAVVGISYRPPVEASAQARSILDQDKASVDQVVATELASVVASSANLAIEPNVANLATSLAAKTELSQVDSSLITKPQIVSSVERKGVRIITTKRGDTVSSIAAEAGVSEDTIRWANNLISDNLRPGTRLKVPGTTGVLYTVKSGDTAKGLADKFKADASRIVTFNNAELTGLKVGQQIIIPDGILPEGERPGYVSPVSRLAAVTSNNRVTVYGGNGYAYGYCTWYAFNRRAELGRPIGSNWGNANTWAAYAAGAGFRVNRTPAAGAVIQNGGGWGGYGHVGIVERVNADGSLLVSDMNYAGWNVISRRTVPASSVSSYMYIH